MTTTVVWTATTTRDDDDGGVDSRGCHEHTTSSSSSCVLCESCRPLLAVKLSGLHCEKKQLAAAKLKRPEVEKLASDRDAIARVKTRVYLTSVFARIEGDKLLVESAGPLGDISALDGVHLRGSFGPTWSSDDIGNSCAIDCCGWDVFLFAGQRCAGWYLYDGIKNSAALTFLHHRSLVDICVVQLLTWTN